MSVYHQLSPTSKSSAIKAACAFLCLVVALSVAKDVFSQELVTSRTDGHTPSGLTAGSPAGSYPLADFETVNPYSGALNVSLPLVRIGGRGNAGYSMMLPIENKWKVEHHVWPPPNPSCFQCPWDSEQTVPVDFYLPALTAGASIVPGYGPGKLEWRGSGEGYTNCSPFTSVYYQTTLTRLTYTAADGTQIEFHDAATNGQARPNPMGGACSTGLGFNRGRSFVAGDGSAAVFISDTDVLDNVLAEDSLGLPSGHLLLADGSTYRVVEGLIVWIRDRNGNKVTGTSDSLGRVVTVTPTDYQSILFDQISFKGFSGASRTMKIWYGTLHEILRVTQPSDSSTIKTYPQLFPTLNLPQMSNYDFDPSWMVRRLELPDGRNYKFFYNVYGELARIELPTGGAIEYDHDGGLSPGTSGLVNFADPSIYRRVIERRVYTDATNLNSLESKTTFSRPQFTSLTNYDDFVDVTAFDSAGTVLSRVRHSYHSHAAASFFTFHAPNAYTDWTEGREYKTEFYDPNNNLLKRVEHLWEQTSPTPPANNPHISRTTTTLTDVTPNLVAKQEFAYDQYNNKTDVYEYDFGSGAPGALVRRMHTDYVTATAYTDASTGAHLRRLPAQVSVFDSGGGERARTTVEYDNYISDSNHAPLVSRTNISGFDGTFSTSYTTRGNVTATTRYLLTNGVVTGSITTYNQYDIAGNVVKSIDGRGFAMNFEFVDRFGAPDGEARSNSQPTELGSASTYAFATRVWNALNHEAFTQYDYYLGQAVDGEDVNGIVASGYFNDPLDRPTQVRRAVGTTVVNQTTFAYDDVARSITTTTDLNSYNDNVLVSKAFYDGLGRTIETRQYEGGTNYIAVKQIPFVRLPDPDTGAWLQSTQSSNPYRPYLGEQPIWITTFFDALDRTVKVRTPDNSIVRKSYSGNTVTVSDQIGKKRKSVTDALGRLKQVYEDPDPPGFNYLTSYGYNVLDNLTTVTQGAQTRSFVYDSLTRLTSATNPESGTISYQYDNNGNLTQKTDARGVISVYVYDALSRNTTVDYSDTASINPDITRIYDTATNGKGLLRESYAGGTETAGANVEHTKIVSYDALGRPLDQRQRFKTNSVWSAEFQTQRTYNRASSLTSQTYPSGRMVTYNYDQAGRLGDKDAQNLAFTGNLGDGVTRNYSSEIVYSSQGGMAKEKFGTDTPLYNKSFYNSRGQLSEIRVGLTPTGGSWQRGAIINHFSAQCWGACNGTDNNGNLKSQDHWIQDASGGVQAIFTQSFAYDNLNRLLRANEGSNWQQEFVYDRWGNRTIHQTNSWGTGINKKDFTVNTANNRLGVPSGQPGVMSYDAAGNLTNDTYTGAGSRVYDAENRMTKAWGGSNQWQEYSYNADGQRTRRKVDGVETRQIYGMDGELLAEYAADAAPAIPQKEYGYRNGQLLVTASNLKGSWKFDENTGTTAADSAGNGNAGTLTSGAGWTTGQTGSSVNLDGVNDYVQVGAQSSLVMTSAASFSSWIYPTGPGSDPTYGGIIVNKEGEYEIARTPNGTIQWAFANSNPGWNWINTGAVAPLNQWTHVAVTYDNGVIKTYLNGNLAHTYNGSGSIGDAIPSQNDFRIGGRQASAQYFQGRIDEVRVYNRALTGSEVSSLLSAGLSAPNINWLVPDQLGTPRIILDKTGALAATRRHDYLPFGEELFAGMGGRTTALGYTADTIRQKFTLKERDNETSLDWFGPGRYYSGVQGRFVSVDPLRASAKAPDPQSWNRYTYALNRATIAIDPDGLSTIVVTVNPRSIGGNGHATVQVFDKNGNDVAVRNGTNRVDGRAIGRKGPNRTVRYADTPFGVYEPLPNYKGSNQNGTTGGVPGLAARPKETQFGTGIIQLKAVSGEVVASGRDSIYIHGGGRDQQGTLAPTLDANQPLTQTEGCVRVTNDDVNALVATVNSLANSGDAVTNVFIGDVATLNAQADEKDKNGNYRYEELRKAGFGSPDNKGKPAGNIP